MNPAHILAAACRTLASWIAPERSPEQLFIDMVFEVFETGKDVRRRTDIAYYVSATIIEHSMTDTYLRREVARIGSDVSFYAGHGSERVKLYGRDKRRAKRLLTQADRQAVEEAEHARVAKLLPRFEAWLDAA